jgi:hypothetical protein
VKPTHLAALVIGIGGIGAAVFLLFAYAPRDLFTPAPDPRVAQPVESSMLPKGLPSRFLTSMPIGAAITEKDRPMVSHVMAADLDQDGMLDVVASIVHAR